MNAEQTGDTAGDQADDPGAILDWKGRPVRCRE